MGVPLQTILIMSYFGVFDMIARDVLEDVDGAEDKENEEYNGG